MEKRQSYDSFEVFEGMIRIDFTIIKRMDGEIRQTQSYKDQMENKVQQRVDEWGLGFR